jgi:hypothetical protein
MTIVTARLAATERMQEMIGRFFANSLVDLEKYAIFAAEM